MAIAYLCGTALSAIAGKIGILVATLSNGRTAEAAQKGIKPAFLIGFRGGAVMGLLVVGCSLLGVAAVLLVTGDPVPSESRDEVKSVFNFNSRKLARYVSSLGEDTFSTPFRLFGALNLNARNFDVQLRLAREKEDCGIRGFLTQPVLSREALDNLRRARETLRGKLLGGIFPVVSYRNACFLNNEVAGIRVCEEIIRLYRDKSREEGEALALEISAAVAKEAAPFVDGFYLMTPFQRVGLIARLLDRFRADGLL